MYLQFNKSKGKRQNIPDGIVVQKNIGNKNWQTKNRSCHELVQTGLITKPLRS